MNKTITFKRGLDLKLQGEVAPGAGSKPVKTEKIAIVPDDFPGFTPKIVVKPGQAVAEGETLMHDKVHTDICLVSPISGIVDEVVRGERRKVLRVTVKPDNAGRKVPAMTAGDTKSALMHSGLWAMMRQRPYDIVPSPDHTPVNIFVTAFDSAPLAPDLADAVAGRSQEIEAGVKALASLTSGKVYVTTREGENINVPSQAEHITVTGPHPSGNAGIQASAIAPVNKGETIWTLDIVTLARIGALMLDGNTYWTTTVALTGSEVTDPRLVDTVIGTDVNDILIGDINNTPAHKRIISGNVLTGVTVGTDGYLRYPYRQITVIPEGDDVDEFMGWASLSPKKMSESRSFPSKIFGRTNFAPDARLQGGRRAMIMSGVYDKVMPMDILPEYLIKAILARDIDKMEALGIYEVAPEDFALCEYVDPSKLELQKIVREGLDYLRKELE